MSWLSDWLSRETEKAAISETQRQAQANRELFQNLFTQLRGEATTAKTTAQERLGAGGKAAQARLTGGIEESKTALQNFLTGQGGFFQQRIGDVMTAGRQQAAKSGLIGGGQEAGIVNPALENIAAQFGQQGLAAQMQHSGMALRSQSGLDQFLMGAQGALDIGSLQAINQLTSGALGGLSGAQQSELGALGTYGSSPFDKLLQAGATVGGFFEG